MGVAMMAMAVATARAARHFFNRDDAPIGFGAASVFELDGAVADVEVVLENVL
jgi:hypothetical protein